MTDGLALGERVVEVLHDRGRREAPNWTVGSGFVVCGGRILTAAHNVGTSGGLLVRFLGGKEHPAAVCTLPDGKPAVDDEFDLAVIELTDPADDRPTLGFARIDAQPTLGTPNVEGCWAVGFPRFQERTRDGRDRPVRESARVDGYIPMGEGMVEGRPTLAAIRSPRELPDNDGRSEWQGISGALVFADRLAIGVITEHHRPAGPGSLIIAPVALLDRTR